MFKNMLLISFRSMLKNKLFIMINILGMSIAIGCCIVGYFAYEYDASFDRMHLNGDRIYRVSANREFNGETRKFGYVPLPMAGVVTQNVKDVDKSTRLHFSWSNLRREDDLFSSNLAYVDPEFFEMFTFDFVNGSPAELKDKTTILVTDKLASKLFGSPQAALGQTITQVHGTELKELRVAGVFREPPQNSSFYYREGYINFENAREEFSNLRDDDWTHSISLFVQIDNPQRVKQVYDQLQPHTTSNNKVREDFIISEFVLDHFPEMGHQDRKAEVDTWTWYPPPQSAIIGSGIMGVMILLISCFNLTNTSIAISSRRLKEIGIRKVMGSARRQLIIQFLGETMLICLVSLILGLLIAGLLVDGWNLMWEFMRLTPRYTDNLPFVGFLVVVLFLAGLLAGGYPAFYISSFEPISILKGRTRFGGTSVLSQVLLAAQFTISLVAIVSAIAFWQNARFQQDYDLGFNIKGSVIAWLNNKEEVEAYKNALAENPKIVSMAGAASGIYSNRLHEPVKHNHEKVETDIIEVGDNYLTTMNLSLTEGRDFIRDSETDKLESVIISRKLADLFGWDQALGKEITYKDSVRLFVVGVVKDVYTTGLWRELDPLVIRYVGPEKYTQLVVSAREEDVPQLNTYMEARWKELFAYRLYNGRLLSLDFQEVEEVNRNIMVMYVFLGIVAMFLSATGLFTLVSLNIIRRMKEIGVRKVLGASILNITRKINTQFFIMLIVASLAGSLIAYGAVNALMGSIWKYYQASNLFTFISAIALMLVVSVASVGFKIYNASSTNPVNTLRDE
jgi:putative ABC transport system permease protein